MMNIEMENKKTTDFKQQNIILYFINKHFRLLIVVLVIILHAVVIFTINFNVAFKKEKKKDNTVFHLVNIREYDPSMQNKVEIARQDKVAEDIIETEKEIKEMDVDYLAQFEITDEPVFPEKMIRQRVVYPTLANKQGIEADVILLLYIDQKGLIREAKVLKDPGYGFAEAAVKALKGIQCTPAKKDGIPAAVMYRYKVKFTLK